MSSNDSTSDLSTSYNFTNNPTRDALIDGILVFMKPTIEQLDEGVQAVKISQVKLQCQLECLSKHIKKINSCAEAVPYDLQPYSETVAYIRNKFTIISNILKATHSHILHNHGYHDYEVHDSRDMSDRLNNLLGHVNLIKEINKNHFSETDSSRLMVSNKGNGAK